MTTPKTNTVEEWELGFDKKFVGIYESPHVEERYKGWNGEATVYNVKSFIHQIIKDERNHMPTQDKYLKWFKGFGLEMASLGIKIPQDLSDLDAVIKGIKDKIAESYDTGFDDSTETS